MKKGKKKVTKTKIVQSLVNGAGFTPEMVIPTEYTATIKVLARTYTAKGVSALQAISNLSVPNAKGKSILTIQKGDVKKEKILMPLPTMRLFNTRGISREIVLKNVSLMFGGL